MSIKTLQRGTDWDNAFLLEAALWSRRSHDTETQCGCVLVKDKSVLSTGYNGFVRDIDDSVLPVTRPNKYPFMIHAEANAVYNAVRIGRCTKNSTAYVTGKPCMNCLQTLYQCGVKEIIYSDISLPKLHNEEGFNTILGLIGSKIDLMYLPKKHLKIQALQETIQEILYDDRGGDQTGMGS